MIKLRLLLLAVCSLLSICISTTYALERSSHKDINQYIATNNAGSLSFNNYLLFSGADCKG